MQIILATRNMIYNSSENVTFRVGIYFRHRS